MTANVRRNLAIQLIPFGGANPLKMRIANPVAFVLGVAGTIASLIAQGGVPAYAYSITSGSLPTGLSLNSSTGVISGTPSAAGTFVFAAKVQDSALTSYIATFSIAVSHILQPTATTPPPVDAGTNTKTYQFAVSGSTGTVTWTSTALPSWATLSTAGLLSIDTLSGLVISGATISPTITASDAGTGDTVSFVAKIVVNPPLQTFAGIAYSTNAPIGAVSLFDAKTAINPFGGQLPYLYQLTPLSYAAAPSWITVNRTTGYLTIAPPATFPPQDVTFDYKITDALGVSTSLVVVVHVVNPQAQTQLQVNGVSVGTPGFSVKNYVGPFVLTNTGGPTSTATITLPAASNSVAGYVSTAAQTIAGPKTFSNNVTAPAYGTPGNNLGTVTTTVAFNFQTDALNIFTFTSGTNVTSATALTNPPFNPGFIAVKSTQAAVASTMTWPTSFKGAWPTTGFLATKTSFFVGYFDGANFNYIGGTQNAY